MERWSSNDKCILFAIFVESARVAVLQKGINQASVSFNMLGGGGRGGLGPGVDGMLFFMEAAMTQSEIRNGMHREILNVFCLSCFIRQSYICVYGPGF